MKKLFLNSFLLFMSTFLFSCSTQETAQPKLYPTTATYDFNGKSYNASEGISDIIPSSYGNIEGNGNSSMFFTLKNKEHNLLFALNKNNGTTISVGDIFVLGSPSIAYENSGSIVGEKSSVFFSDGNSKKEWLSSLTSTDESTSYFKVTRNDSDLFEGQFQFVYGLPINKTNTTAKAVGNIKNGFVSIKKRK